MNHTLFMRLKPGQDFPDLGYIMGVHLYPFTFVP